MSQLHENSRRPMLQWNLRFLMLVVTAICIIAAMIANDLWFCLLLFLGVCGVRLLLVDAFRAREPGDLAVFPAAGVAIYASLNVAVFFCVVTSDPYAIFSTEYRIVCVFAGPIGFCLIAVWGAVVTRRIPWQGVLGLVICATCVGMMQFTMICLCAASV